MISKDNLKHELVTLDCPNGSFAIIANIGPGELSKWLNGQRELSNSEATSIELALADIKKLADSVQPKVPVNFRNALLIKKIIEEQAQAPIDEIRNTICDLRINGTIFTQLQFESSYSVFDIDRVLAGQSTDAEQVRYLLSLARGLRVLQADLDLEGADWRDVNMIRGLLKRRRDQAREEAMKQ